MLRRINQALPGLLLGIVFYGLALWLVGIWFVGDRIQYTVGLWIGVALAAGMAVNMAIVILDTVEAMEENRSSRKPLLYAVVRYVVLVAAFLAVWYLKIGNVIAMFAGVMGLKIAAYLQPFTHKFIVALQGRTLHGRRIKNKKI